MEERENNIRLLKRMSNKIFVKNDDVNLAAPNVIAAIIKSGREMAMVSDVTDKDTAYGALLEAYGALENEQVKDLVEMLSPTFVHSIIGFATDFTDYSRAAVAYQSQKTEYDELYRQANIVYNSKEQAKSL